MQRIDCNAKGIAFIVDDKRHLMGTVTDGDIRRALLHGATLDTPIDPHMQKQFVAVGDNASRAEVLDLMRARSIGQLPILDTDGKLVGVHVLGEIIGAVVRPNRAVIMAGGRGERLRPLTDALPKPMIRVAGKPILERLVLHLVGYGIREIYLAVHYLSEVIEKHFGDGSRFGCTIRYLHEDRPLGTGGALSLLSEMPTHPLLVMNGDLVTEADIGAMLALHHADQHSVTVGVHEYSHTVPYGCLDVEGDRVVRYEEKPVLFRLVNAGVYVLSPAAVKRVPKDQEFPLPALVEQALALGDKVGVFRIEDDWIDVGQRKQLGTAQRGFLRLALQAGLVWLGVWRSFAGWNSAAELSALAGV
jgi:dTDP-glucose pyrophosphorylase